jgi:hypothetical protein
MGNGAAFVTFFVIRPPDKTPLTRAHHTMIVNVTASAGAQSGMRAGGPIQKGGGS